MISLKFQVHTVEKSVREVFDALSMKMVPRDVATVIMSPVTGVDPGNATHLVGLPDGRLSLGLVDSATLDELGAGTFNVTFDKLEEPAAIEVAKEEAAPEAPSS